MKFGGSERAYKTCNRFCESCTVERIKLRGFGVKKKTQSELVEMLQDAGRCHLGKGLKCQKVMAFSEAIRDSMETWKT